MTTRFVLLLLTQRTNCCQPALARPTRLSHPLPRTRGQQCSAGASPSSSSSSSSRSPSDPPSLHTQPLRVRPRCASTCPALDPVPVPSPQPTPHPPLTCTSRPPLDQVNTFSPEGRLFQGELHSDKLCHSEVLTYPAPPTSRVRHRGHQGAPPPPPHPHFDPLLPQSLST